MSMVIAGLICVLLLTVSLAHFIWGFGGTWPIRNRNEKLLAQTVIGYAGIQAMPARWLSLAVALGTLVAAVLALALADPESGGALLSLAGGAFGTVFVARGVLGFTPRWQALTPTEPFRTNDARVYSPACLAIAIGFFALVLLRLL